MITKKTVLILGAGASMPFRFPSGDQLVDSVKRTLGAAARDPKSVGGALSKDSPVRILMELGHSREQIAGFIADLDQAQTRSIDAFLERRQDYVALGKAAMAIEIHRWENREALFKDRSHWYQFLLDAIDTGPWEELVENKLAVVTYNYDRSLEAYLFWALSARHKRSLSECAEVLSGIPVVHLHGSLGKLRMGQDGDGLPYEGRKMNSEMVGVMAANMIVIHEGQDDSKEYQQASKLLLDADRVYCLGFGYGRTNLRRLNCTIMPVGRGKSLAASRNSHSPRERGLRVPVPSN